MAESVLLADGSNQNSASVQLVSAREDHSSTAARASNTFLHTGGTRGKRAGRPTGAEEAAKGDRTRKEDRKFRIIKASNLFFIMNELAADMWYGLILLTVI